MSEAPGRMLSVPSVENALGNYWNFPNWKGVVSSVSSFVSLILCCV